MIDSKVDNGSFHISTSQKPTTSAYVSKKDILRRRKVDSTRNIKNLDKMQYILATENNKLAGGQLSASKVLRSTTGGSVRQDKSA